MLQETPSLRAVHHEKQLSRRKCWCRRSKPAAGAKPDRPEDTRPSALVVAALACLDVAATGWVACEGTKHCSAVLLDRAMGAFAEWTARAVSPTAGHLPVDDGCGLAGVAFREPSRRTRPVLSVRPSCSAIESGSAEFPEGPVGMLHSRIRLQGGTA